MLRTPSNNALDQNFIKFGAYVTVRCDLYGKNINMKSGNPSSTDPYHYDQFSELFSYCMAVGRGTVMAVPVFTATMLVLWPIGRLSRTHFHYHTDNCRTAFHGFPTALLCLVHMGVNPGGDGGDASPPLFGVGGTPILIVPPTFCQGWIQV